MERHRISIAAGLMGVALAASCLAHAAPKKDAAPPAPAAASEPVFNPECLTISRSSSSTYMIANSNCPAESVLAAIELAADGPYARCFTKKIRGQISIASEGVAPAINYQCIEGAAGCSMAELRGMFPECHAS